MLEAYFGNSRPDVREMIIGRFPEMLDVGCGQGALGLALMAEGKVDCCDGVELVESQATRAAAHYRSVFVGAVEDYLTESISKRYNLIVCADVLEHLVDPWTALRGLVSLLQPGGSVIVSVPNVSFAPVLLGLMRGKFEYSDWGVLDRTHLRFFTRDSAIELLESAGLNVVAVRAKKSSGRLLGLVARGLGDKGSAQFILIGRAQACE